MPITKPIKVNANQRPIAINIRRMKRRREITGWRPCSKMRRGIIMRVSTVYGFVRGCRRPQWHSRGTMLSIGGHSNETMVELLAGVTLLISWIFIQVAFARYYAQEFYSRK